MSITQPGGQAEVRAEMEAQFGPVNPSLLPAEQALLTSGRDKMAFVIARLIPYITANAVVSTTGADPQGGTVSSTGTVS